MEMIAVALVLLALAVLLVAMKLGDMVVELRKQRQDDEQARHRAF